MQPQHPDFSMRLSPKSKDRSGRSSANQQKNTKQSAALKPAVNRDTAPKDHLEIRIWLRLLASASRLESILQSRFTREFGISLARFDVLSQLERSGDGLTMTETSRRMMVTNGAITSLVDRLVDEGFVMREAHPEDRRTTILRLTDSGRERFHTMAAEHEQWVVGLLSGVDKQTKQDLVKNLAVLKHHLEELGA
jgi:DNA-binding MarR family transcriptional regulator